VLTYHRRQRTRERLYRFCGLKGQLHSQRPLLEREMETDGTSIFVTELGSLIDASQDGQLAMNLFFDCRL
jgi:hypothetical protein